VSDYGLDDRAIEVRSPAGARDFSSILCVQTGSGAHPASCTMGTRGPFPGGKVRPGRDADHSPPSSTEVENELELYILSPQTPPWRVAGLLYFTSNSSTVTGFFEQGVLKPQACFSRELALPIKGVISVLVARFSTRRQSADICCPVFRTISTESNGRSKTGYNSEAKPLMSRHA
jgi:hypothetical protein